MRIRTRISQTYRKNPTSTLSGRLPSPLPWQCLTLLRRHARAPWLTTVAMEDMAAATVGPAVAAHLPVCPECRPTHGGLLGHLCLACCPTHAEKLPSSPPRQCRALLRHTLPPSRSRVKPRRAFPLMGHSPSPEGRPMHGGL